MIVGLLIMMFVGVLSYDIELDEDAVFDDEYEYENEMDVDDYDDYDDEEDDIEEEYEEEDEEENNDDDDISIDEALKHIEEKTKHAKSWVEGKQKKKYAQGQSKGSFENQRILQSIRAKIGAFNKK